MFFYVAENCVPKAVWMLVSVIGAAVQLEKDILS